MKPQVPDGKERVLIQPPPSVKALPNDHPGVLPATAAGDPEEGPGILPGTHEEFCAADTLALGVPRRPREGGR